MTLPADNPNHVRHADLSGAVIWLEPASDDLQAPPRARHYQMLQKNKRFTPHVLAIPVGSTVDFPNDDPIFHNAFSNYNGQMFDIGLYPPGTSRSINFRRKGIVRVFCNIHSTMSAVIVVLDTPYFALTDREGDYHMEGIPPGTYHLHVFHEQADERTLQNLTRDIDISHPNEQIAPIVVPETGYLAVTHLNKYGRPYRPEPASPGTYQGAHQ